MSAFPTDLVAQARRGDPAATERLVDLTLPVVLRWCVRLCGAGVNAEDAAHDTLIVVLDRLPSLQQPEAYAVWLYGCTRRVLARHRRKAWLRRWVPGAAVEERVDPALDPLDRSAQSETIRRVRAALAQVSVEHREVLVLCDLEERSNTEVAEMLGIPPNTVRSRLNRARAKLRELVAELPSDNLVALERATGGRR